MEIFKLGFGSFCHPGEFLGKNISRIDIAFIREYQALLDNVE